MNSWKSTENLAKWENESVALSFGQSNSSKGLSLHHTATQLTLNLFDVVSSIDKNVRFVSPKNITPCGSTLHATFPESDEFPVETQIAWSVLDVPAAIAGIDVVVSVRTQKLDAHPQIEVCSSLGDADLLLPGNLEDETASNGASCSLFRLRNANLSYLEMLLPAEIHSTQATKDPGTGCSVLRHHLFSCPLEKGVILRARLRGLLLPRDADETATNACFKEFLSASPPLGR